MYDSFFGACRVIHLMFGRKLNRGFPVLMQHLNILTQVIGDKRFH